MQEDESVLERDADEEAAELRWDTFVEVVLSYADSDGWPAVLAAVAWAKKERQEES